MIRVGKRPRVKIYRNANSKRFIYGNDDLWRMSWKNQLYSYSKDFCNRSCMNFARHKGTIWGEEREVMTQGVNVG